LGVNHLTAWRMLFTKAQFKPWETVLVLAWAAASHSTLVSASRRTPTLCHGPSSSRGRSFGVPLRETAQRAWLGQVWRQGRRVDPHATGADRSHCSPGAPAAYSSAPLGHAISPTQIKRYSITSASTQNLRIFPRRGFLRGLRALPGGDTWPHAVEMPIRPHGMTRASNSPSLEGHARHRPM
jgi:hypothetical protein